MRIRIRRFRLGDAEYCFGIMAEDTILIYSDIRSSKVIWSYISTNFPSTFISRVKKGRIIYVAESKGKILGYVAFRKKGARAHIGHLFVRYSCRNKGIGKKLMEVAEGIIRKRFDVKKIGLNAADFKPTVGFYEGLGYKRTGKVEYFGPKSLRKSEKGRALYMEKRL